jgi:hypothetical protein
MTGTNDLVIIAGGSAGLTATEPGLHPGPAADRVT